MILPGPRQQAADRSQITNRLHTQIHSPIAIGLGAGAFSSAAALQENIDPTCNRTGNILTWTLPGKVDVWVGSLESPVTSVDIRARGEFDIGTISARTADELGIDPVTAEYSVGIAGVPNSQRTCTEPMTDRGVAIDELAMYVEAHGVSQEIAESEILAQAELAEPFARLIELAGNRLAGYGIDNSKYLMEPMVLLAGGERAPELEDFARTAGISIRYGASLNWEELHELSKRLRDEFHDSGVLIGVDTFAAKVVVNRLPDPDVKEMSRRQDLDKYVGSSPYQSEITFTEFRFSTEPTARYKGGERFKRVYQYGNSLGGCTSGFAVKWGPALDRYGVLTAGHCADAGTLDSLRTQRKHQSSGWGIFSNRGYVYEESALDWEDIALYEPPGGDKMVPKFYYGNGTRTVKGTYYTPNGMWVCFYGRQTNEKICGNTTQNGDPWPGTTWVEGPAVKIAPGDSGGPVYRNIGTNTGATGILIGGVFDGEPFESPLIAAVYQQIHFGLQLLEDSDPAIGNVNIMTG